MAQKMKFTPGGDDGDNDERSDSKKSSAMSDAKARAAKMREIAKKHLAAVGTDRDVREKLHKIQQEGGE